MASEPELVIETPEQARSVLALLGEQRLQREHEDEELAKLVREALNKSNGLVTRTEAADLLKMHRTTLYRVYGSDD